MSKRFSSKLEEDQTLAKFDTNYFGLTSDWHIGSKYTDEEKILDYLDYLKECGIKDVFHGGDFFDGNNIYRRQHKNLRTYCETLKGQVEYFNEVFSEQKDLTINSIAGNHDKKGKQMNQIKRLSSQRKDINYLGRYSADIELSDEIILRLLHPSRNSGYPSMINPKKYINPDYYNANILGLGHMHKSDKMRIGDIRVYNLGCFKEVPSKNRVNNIGGWVVELEGEEGKLISNSSEWIYY